MDTTDTLDILLQKQTYPITINDINKIENKDHLPIPIQHNNRSESKTEYFAKRDLKQKTAVLFEFLTKGIDLEDINYLKQRYYFELANKRLYNIKYWLNESRWVNHPDILFLILKFRIKCKVILCKIG